LYTLPVCMQATEQPLCEVPQPLLNTITNFVGGVGDDALLAMCVPLTAAVISEAVGGPSGTAPTGKGKAGLQIMLAAILRTRPQVREAQYRCSWLTRSMCLACLQAAWGGVEPGAACAFHSRQE
jgi:hypothetical protein